MGNRDTRIGGGEVGVEVYGAISDLQKTIKNLGVGREASILIDLPAVDTSFTPIFETEGRDIFVTLKYFIPGFTEELTVMMVDATQIVDEDAYARKRKKYVHDDISDADREAQEMERRFEVPLKPEREHHVILLRAWDERGNPHTNPEGGLDYSGYPGNVLFTFTTPAAVGISPNRPHVGNIIENQLDDSTPKRLDAFVSVQIIAPASNSVAATGTVTVTQNSTTVTGSGTAFLTQFPDGSAIEVNGETHIVSGTPASNTSLTVDYPFKQATASGQSATAKTLHTWASADVHAVAPKFQLSVNPPDTKAISPHHVITEEEAPLTSLTMRVHGFVAAMSYDYKHNIAVSLDNLRGEASPLTTQSFIAGNFGTDINLITGEFIYDATDPVNENQRATFFAITQPSPPFLMEEYQFFKRRVGTGTISIANGTNACVGVGTGFTTELASGHFIIAGAQTFEVDSITDDTHLTTIENASPAVSASAFTISIKNDENSLLRGKFHPSAGGRIKPIYLGDIKTKKLTAYDFVFTIKGADGTSKSFTDNFTTDSSGAGAATPGALAFPSAPTGSDNTLDGDPENANAKITLNIATVSGTFAANNITEITAILRYLDASGTEDTTRKLSPIIAISSTDSGLSTIALTFYAPMGSRLRLKRVVALNGDKSTETVGTVDFYAGNVVKVAAADAQALPVPGLTLTNLDNKTDSLVVTVAQLGGANPIILLKKLIIEIDDGGGTYRKYTGEGLKEEDTLYTSNTANISFTYRVPRRAGNTVAYRARVISVGGKVGSNGTTSGGATAGDTTIPAPGALTFPSAPSAANNTVDGDPDKNLARVVIAIAPAAGTYSANNISDLEIIYTMRNAANSANVGSPQTHKHALSTADLAASTLNAQFYVRPGENYRITAVVARNGHLRTETTGTADFLGGNILKVDAADATTVPAPTFFSQPATDGNKIANFTIRVTQATVIVWLKKLKVEVSYGGGTFRQIEGSPVGLKSSDTLHLTTTSSEDFVFSCKRKAGVTLDVRATVIAVGGKASSTTNATQLAANAGDAVDDTAVPSSLGTPTLKFVPRSGLVIENLTVGANFNTLLSKHLVIRDSDNTPVTPNFEFLDLPTLMSSGGETVTKVTAAGDTSYRYDVGARKTHIIIPVRLASLKTTFGSTRSLIAYFYATNSQGISSTIGVSSALGPLSNAKDILGSNNAVRVLDVGATLVSPGNILKNGDFNLEGSAANILGTWSFWDGSTFPISSFAGSDITTTSTTIKWEQGLHAIRCESGATRYLVGSVKRRLQPGEEYAITMLVRHVGGSNWTLGITPHFYNVSRSSSVDNIDSAFTVSVSFTTVGTIYKLIQFNVKMKESPDLPTVAAGSVAANHAVVFVFDTMTQDVIVDKVMMVRGRTAMLFAPYADEIDAGTVTPTLATFTAMPDQIDIVGTQGNGFGGNSGGEVSLS